MYLACGMANPFAVTERETLKLIKQDGSEIDGLRTSGISKGKVTFFRDDIDPEEGDMLERVLPNGRVELYQIDDVQFRAALNPIPGHYVLQVSNTAKPKPQLAPTSVTYNLHGNNNRVNIHSNDHSHNSVGIEPSDLFTRIDETLAASVSNAEQLASLRATLADMQAQQGQPSFAEYYVRFMGLAADHLGVLTPFLPALAQLITMVRPGS